MMGRERKGMKLKFFITKISKNMMGRERKGMKLKF